MFLNELNKKEAIHFVNLVENLAKIDGVYSEDEKNLIKDYLEELSLTNEIIEHLDMELALNGLLASSDKIKNIIYFELLGLALIDGCYEDEEINFLNNIAVHFNISKEKQNQYVNFFQEVKNLYDATAVEYADKLELLEKDALELVSK